MEIILLRHGKPEMPSLEKTNAAGFSRWVELYNLSRLCSSSIPSSDVVSEAKLCTVVVCSELQRSIDSAKALGFNEVTLKSSIFNEAGMPVANWEYLKLSPKLWSIVFRILWLFGYSFDSESFKEAKLRASKSARVLIDLAKKHERVIFVGHGVYNRILAKELKSLGWAGPKNPGSKYWSYAVYSGKKHNK